MAAFGKYLSPCFDVFNGPPPECIGDKSCPHHVLRRGGSQRNLSSRICSRFTRSVLRVADVPENKYSDDHVHRAEHCDGVEYQQARLHHSPFYLNCIPAQCQPIPFLYHKISPVDILVSGLG